MDVRNDEELKGVLENMTDGFLAARMALKSIQQTLVRASPSDQTVVDYFPVGNFWMFRTAYPCFPLSTILCCSTCSLWSWSLHGAPLVTVSPPASILHNHSVQLAVVFGAIILGIWLIP